MKNMVEGHPQERQGPSSVTELLGDIVRSVDPAWRLGWNLFLALNLATFGMNAIAQETRTSLEECLSQKPSPMCQDIE